MAITSNRYFNNPGIAQAAANLSSLFAPAMGAESGSDAAGYAMADARRAEMNNLGRLFDYAQDPNLDQTRFDRMGLAAGRWTPNQSFYSVDQGNATTLQERRMMEDGLMRRQLAEPIAVNQDQRVFLPPAVAGQLDMPTLLEGNRSPLSETQQRATERQRLIEAGVITDDMLTQDFLGERTPVQALDPTGKPIFTTPGAAVQQGLSPAPKGPDTVVNMGPNGVDYGDPGKGLVWARDAEGNVKLDERGAPVAIPFQGGEVWQKQQAAEAANAVGDARSTTKNNIVLEDISRALTMINDSPLLTTGVGNQITGAVGGTPAYNLNAIIDTVKANVGFDQLQAMRDASPTGGALGQVSEMENRLLQSVLGSLETAQSKPQLEQNLKRLYQVVDEIVNGPADRRAAMQGGAPAAPAPASGGTPEGTIIENDAGQRMIKRNGTWEPYDGR